MPDPLRLVLKLEGPLVAEHRLPLSELQRVAQHLRGTLRSVAVVVTQSGPSGQSGRVKKYIEDAVDLRVVGAPQAGSFMLELEVPPDPPAPAEKLSVDLGPHLGERAVQTFISGLEQLSDGAERLPEGFDRGVLRALNGFRQTMTRGISEVVLEAANGDVPRLQTRIGKEKLEVAKRLISRPVISDMTVEGTLRMVDDATLECRIDRPPSPSVTVFFGETHRDLVWQAGQGRKYVRVSGEGEFHPGEEFPRRVQATDIEILYEEAPFDPRVFWQHKTIDEVVSGRAVARFDLRPDDEWRDDAEAEALIAAMTEAD